jgi:hypothetical protein
MHRGVRGKSQSTFKQLINNLSYALEGKLVMDFTDGSQDVIYVTTDSLSLLKSSQVRDQLQHHVRVMAFVAPMLEVAVGELGLAPKQQETKAERRAREWVTRYTGTELLPGAKSFRYLAAKGR